MKKQISLSSKLIVLVIFITSACSSIFPEDELCELSNLLINDESFPGEGWFETGSRTLRGAPIRMGAGRVGTSFNHPIGGVALNGIYYFKKVEDAENAFLRDLDYQRSLLFEGTECEDVFWFSDLLTKASESQEYICTEPEGLKRYIAVMRYETYVVDFLADMVVLEPADIQGILADIDDLFNICPIR